MLGPSCWGAALSRIWDGGRVVGPLTAEGLVDTVGLKVTVRGDRVAAAEKG